jgi:hypothetical protein
MPATNGDTFQCKPISEFVQRYYSPNLVSIDPFARNSQLATFTNDLNPNTSARYNLDVVEFLELLVDREVMADLIIFDPPYSPRQVKELYDSIGIETGKEMAWRTASWKNEKILCNKLLKMGGVFLHFGWNTMGICQGNYKTEEIMLVCHGAAHNDTICMAQRKFADQLAFNI